MDLTLTDYRDDRARNGSPGQRQHQRAEGAQGSSDEEHREIGGMNEVLGKQLIEVHETSSLNMEASLRAARLMG